jgi:O-glycosyl hydrolase
MLLDPKGGSDFELVLPYRYHAFGQFSRFVRPGAVRVEVTGSSSAVETVAFEIPGGGVVVVLTNTGTSDVMANVQGLSGVASLLRTRTAAGEKGAVVGQHTVTGGTATFRLPARSITTVTSNPPT